MVQKGKRWDGQQWVEGSPANEEGEAKARRKPRREATPGAVAERNPRPGSPEQHDGRRKTSQHRGVAFNNGKWYATITVNSKRKHIGAFGSEDEAARAYEAECRRIGRDPNRTPTSKHRGVCWIKGEQKWRAALKVGGKTRYLGYFTNEEAASEAYQAACREIGLDRSPS